MEITGSTLKEELLERLIGSVRDRVEPEDGDRAGELARRAVEHIPLEELLECSLEDEAAAIASLWRLGRERERESLRIRVLNPSPENDEWSSPHTVIQLVNDDMPFLLASITGELHRRKRRIHRVLHPVVPVRRDGAGRVEEMGAEGSPLESWMHIEIDRETLGAHGLDELRDDLATVLEEVRIVVRDWGPMKGQVRDVLDELDAGSYPVPDDEVDESRAFLSWLLDDHYTFLGYRQYELVREGEETFLRPVPDSGLGLLGEGSDESNGRGEGALSESLAEFLKRQELLFITKSSRRSRVHRAVHMDSVGVRRFDASGRVVGEHRFVGLFTSTVYTARAKNVPVLRRKVERIMARGDFTPGSHDAKALRHVLESFPRDELFQIREEDLFRIAMGILRLQQQHRVALFVRRDEFERFISCLVYVPRESYTFDLRQRMQDLLERAFAGEVTAFYTQMSDAPLARTHYIVRTTPGEIPNVDLKQVEASLAEAARSWTEHLREHLVRKHGEEIGLALLGKYGQAFPVTYRERFPAKAALADIQVMQVLLGTGQEFDARLYRPPGLEAGWMRLKLYRQGRHISLSDALPVLENLGVRVESELPIEVHPEGEEEPVWIHDFELRSVDGVEVSFEEIKEGLEETVRRVWQGDLENGVLNRLVLAAGMEWHEVVVLRAYSRYLRQIGITFSQRYMAQTLVRNRGLARDLFRLFVALFDPSNPEESRSLAAAALADIRSGLETVDSLDEDRILRGFLSVIRATLRTNYYQRLPGGSRKPYLSVKLDGSAIRDLPDPRPMFEIFVYSPRVEGVHLRGGRVARGGIRWSDRREDFRTEILGLLKAQMVKNAVIVPVGAKGGFVVKRPPLEGGREALLAEGVECYRTLMRGMLDLTDNRVDGVGVPPPDVVCRDEEDPYLVVAADKGTATFSDIANGVAAEYGFWLGDAFASGGSAGYDHKKMGITARGAWEAVKRHFRERGTDIQREDFTVVGVGDMSGDVFGNGMLLSRHTRLVGAFNHLHVFVDPDPDPEVSFAERQRLFQLPRSTWTDYDAAKISAGGGVFERSAKSIPVSPEMQERFGIEGSKITPNELIQTLLKAKVDLLWFGGIGTFVKASEERHGDVGDRANDAVRVDAADLRCEVVGEGANLGFTQAARIEYALGGGRINTDAIDNSGGVDTSDHEVNIKIALGPVVRRDELSIAERNDLLEAMTEEVAGLVLRDNYLQTQAISLAERRAPELLDQQARMIRGLERAHKLDRALENLPDEEGLAERASLGRGLTRPELAVLLAYAKISLYETLLASDLPDDPLLAEDLLRYFPRPLAERYAEALESHDLRREIIATYVTNSTVNRVGPSFVFRLTEATGREVRDVARAYTIARDSLDLRPLWVAIERLDNKVPSALQLLMLEEAARLIERVTLWLLRRFEGPLAVAEIVKRYRKPLHDLARALPDLLPGVARRDLRRRARELEKGGVPEALALQVAGLRGLAAGVDIVRLALDSECDVERVARIYFGLGEQFGLAWLRTNAQTIDVESAWEQSALEALLDDLYRYQSDLARQVLGAAADGAGWKEAIASWSEARPGAVGQALKVMEEVRAAKGFDLSMLTVVEHQLKNLVAT